MLTYRNTTATPASRDIVAFGTHEVRCTWDAAGAHVDTADLRRLRDAGLAAWSDEEIGDLAYHAETIMDEAYTKAYDIVTFEGFNMDTVNVLESIRMTDDAAATAYAEEHHAGQEWYVLDANGQNING